MDTKTETLIIQNKLVKQVNTSKPKAVIAHLPNAGMANLLFTWAKALVFSKIYDIPYFVFGWSRLHIGPWLRGERVKRYYGKYFQSRIDWIKYWEYRYLKKSAVDLLFIEPDVKPGLNLENKKYIVFDLIPFPDRKPYFEGLWNYRNYIKEAFYKLLKPAFKYDGEHIDIAVHIRRGDFEKNPRFLPNAYFVDCINQIRAKYGAELRVKIFTDGFKSDVKEVLGLPNVELSEIKKDILEFQALMNCKILITSFDSTFGYWAGFLSNAHIILHEKHFGGRIRSVDFPKFEGTVTKFLKEAHSL